MPNIGKPEFNLECNLPRTGVHQMGQHRCYLANLMSIISYVSCRFMVIICLHNSVKLSSLNDICPCLHLNVYKLYPFTY